MWFQNIIYIILKGWSGELILNENLSFGDKMDKMEPLYVAM